jgi:glucan endo-1,3-alpha-glucosidase
MSSTATSTSTGPVVVRTAGAYTYVDCHTDSVTARALTGTDAQGSMMTVEYCASVCAGSTYMAVEYGGECEPLKALSVNSLTFYRLLRKHFEQRQCDSY